MSQISSLNFDMEALVGSTIKQAQARVQQSSATPVEKVASVATEDLGAEAEKLAAACEYAVAALRQGAVDLARNDIERVKEAFAIVAAAQRNPVLMAQVKQAMGSPPTNPGDGKGIGIGSVTGSAPSNALPNDLTSPPGGGQTQQRATASAPTSLQPSQKPADAGTVAGNQQGGPPAVANDRHDRPGGEAGYPQEGIIRKLARSTAALKLAKLKKGASQAPIGRPEGATMSGEGKAPRGPSEVSSNQKAIDYTKRDALTGADGVTDDLSKVLTQPAFSAKHDDVLQKNLSQLDGAKIASAQMANMVRAELTRRVRSGELRADQVKLAMDSSSESGDEDKTRGSSPDEEEQQKAKQQKAFRESLSATARKKGEEDKDKGTSQMPSDKSNSSRPSMPGY